MSQQCEQANNLYLALFSPKLASLTVTTNNTRETTEGEGRDEGDKPETGNIITPFCQDLLISLLIVIHLQYVSI